jgi:multidrug transporter EmrE-like cation transporter
MSRFLPQILLATALTLNAAANVLIKYSATRMHPLPAGAPLSARLLVFLHPAFVLGLLLFALNVFAYQGALRSLRLSVAYPVMVSGGYLLILLASWFVFQERLAPVQYCGVGLILFGIWLVVR